ncbi:hypothetical protein K501DRAFT_76763 [Backusella circina FSU 941]|nr:hypothetical protein K501DRAFT_76763 [Backusella circina FSU 941]
MDTDDDMPNFLSGANTRRVDFSDSEDDTLLSSTLDHDGFEGLNVSDKIKNIMSIDNFYMDNTFDDQNDALFEMPESLKNREMPSTSEPTENRFMNFPFNKPESSPPPAAPQKKKRASASKKPKEKKRKRDRGKKDKEIPQDVMERPVNHERTTAFLKELAGAMDFSSDDEESGRLYKPKPKKTRKTRKPKSLQQMDENGEQMMRTTDILGDTSSSEDDDKRMTKRDELEMYRETDRLRREADISIKPTFHKKSFNDFVSRLANRKSQIEHKPTPPIKQPISKQDEFEDDLEIVGGPTSLLSPSKPSAIPWSPVATSNNVHKKHNQQLRDRIAQHMYTRRKEMEEAAISRGEYTSATDRAKKTLQREKENELIFMEVNKHFNKSKNNDDDEEEEEDGDYNDEEGYDDDDDIMGEYSGQEEDDDEEDEEEEEDNDDQEEKDGESTPKDNNNNDDDENEEDDLATVAFKRWKRKPGKKSIFDDDDDEVEKPKVEAKKPEPKHSIAKFFKNNTKTITTVKNNVTDGNKPLSRLKQRDESIEEEEDEEQGETEQAREDESMDIDEEPTKQHVTFAPIAAKPQGPKPSSRYLEEEAEEEEDEHFGAGGPDVDDTEDLDQFEDDGLLVERNEETDNVDESVLKGKYR